MTRTLLIFAKSPRMGLAKTRLARGTSRSTARRIARLGFAHTLQAATDPRWQTRLYAAPDNDLYECFGGLWPVGLQRHSQGRGDLGERLARGLSEAPLGPVVFIGSDAPDVSKALVWRAFRALSRADCVIGPASDGGFWLLGLHRRIRANHPFDNVRWSSAETLSDVEVNLPAGARIARLPELVDLDEAEDWRAWAASRRRSCAG
jgi:rSAM/selenodomain-associated transferase 1